MQDAHGFEILNVDVGSQALRAGVKRGESRTPLVIFNGIGANLELLEGVAAALQGIEVVTFDVPGVGGSALPRRPYRLKTLARLTEGVLDALGYRGSVDAVGVSWGELCIGHMDQWVAQACKNESRLPKAPQPGHGRPPHERELLQEISAPVRRPHVPRERDHQVGLLRDLAAVASAHSTQPPATRR